MQSIEIQEDAMSIQTSGFSAGQRVWHRSDAGGAAGTVLRFEEVGGERCAIVQWDDESDPMPTLLTALVAERSDTFRP